jgi:hypothetical protein
MAVETVPIDSAEMFRDAMSEEPAAEVTAPEPTETAEERRARDEKGRFVAQEPEPAPVETPPAVTPAPEAKDEAQVPSWRLREVRERGEAAERRAEQEAQEKFALRQQFDAMQRELAQLKAPKPEPVDFYANPELALQQSIQPFQQQYQSLEQRLVMRASRAEAISEFGKPAIVEMEEAIGKALQSNHPDMQQLSTQMRASDDPVGVAMKWYQRDKLATETGGDINAYRQRILDEAMKDPAFQAKVIEATRQQTQTTQPRPNIQLPPSLNKASGAAGASEYADDDGSDGAIFRHAMSAPRRR